MNQFELDIVDSTHWFNDDYRSETSIQPKLVPFKRIQKVYFPFPLFFEILSFGVYDGFESFDPNKKYDSECFLRKLNENLNSASF
jgi:hypothetical protein